MMGVSGTGAGKGARFTAAIAVHLFLVRRGKILLLRRFSTGYEDGNYSVVAGHLNGNEPVQAAMAREAREEVGIKVSPQDLTVVGVMHRKTAGRESVDFFLAAERWEGKIRNAEPDRCDHLAWFGVHSLPSNTVPYIRKALQNYLQGAFFDSCGWD